MSGDTYYPMTSTASSSSRSTGTAMKALRAVTHSRTAGIVAAVVGAAVTSAVGAALIKKSRAANKKKTAAATAKKRPAARAKSPRRATKSKTKTAAPRA